MKPQHFDHLKRRIAEESFWVVDTETTGLNVRRDTVIGVGLSCSAEESYYIPLYYYDTDKKNLVSCDTQAGCDEVLNLLHGKNLICHNASYDLRIIKHDLQVDLLDSLHTDTMLLKHTCDEVPPFALKDIATMLYGADSKAEQTLLKESIKQNGGSVTKKSYELYKANMPIIAKYCEQDCKLTFKIFQHYSKILESEGLQKFFYEDEVMPLYKIATIPTESAGLPLDITYMEQSLAEIKEDAKLLEAEVQAKLSEICSDFKTYFYNKYYPVKKSGNFIQKLCEMEGEQLPLTATGRLSISKKTFQLIKSDKVKTLIETGTIDDETASRIQDKLHHTGNSSGYFINLQSKAHLRKIVFDYLGEKPQKFTEKGAFQLDDKFLTTLKGKYSFIEPLIAYNKLLKIQSTYIERFLEEQEDGIMFPAFMQHRTISGRYGSNIQQLPRAIETGHPLVVKYNNRIRNFFIAGEGYKFVGADQNSLEVRVFAHVSSDKNIQDVFRNGEDFYSKIAIMTEGLTEYSANKTSENYLGKLNKTARQRAKAFGLGIAYGLTGFKLAKELNIEQSEGDKIVRKYLQSFPSLHKWMLETDKKVLKTGRVSSIAGRIRRMPKAVEIFEKHGSCILDDLELWKRYNENKQQYAEAKEDRKILKNYLNNGRNFQIQSLAASIINQSSIKINQKFKLKNMQATIVMNLHDEIVVRCSDCEVEQVKQIMQYEMENIFKLDIPLIAEPQVGYRYGETK